MSRLGRRDRPLIQAVMEAVAAFQDATDRLDESAAERLGLNRTDLRCLGVLVRAANATAGELAAAAGLSPGAATTAVDRLVTAGYARRASDPDDRRRVLVQATPTARKRAGEIWGPIEQESVRRLSRRSDAQLRTIHDFLEEGRGLQVEHAERIRRQRPAG
jgi:DNA-binding MarR family transcriptional regulator